uniref:T9SS type A sorting domain-containing protein n=1 Tax=candidate division WOR-3 bacterium TaxID=2052148 RepID=A0A7V0Z4K8_UNCW3
MDDSNYCYGAGYTYDGTIYRLLVVRCHPDNQDFLFNYREPQNPVYFNYSIKLDSEGNVYVATMNSTDAWLVTFDRNLNYRGQLILDYGGLDIFNDVEVIGVNRVVVTGRIEKPLGSSTDNDMFVGEYFFNPQTHMFYEQWHYVLFPQDEYSIEKGHKVKKDNYGNIYVAGTTQVGSGHGYSHVCVLKFSPDGVLQWMYNHNDPLDGSSSPCDLAVDKMTGQCFTTGTIYRSYLNSLVQTMKIDNGNLVWKNESDITSSVDIGYELDITPSFVYVSGAVNVNAEFLTMCYWRSTGDTRMIERYNYGNAGHSFNIALKRNGNYAYVVSAGYKTNPYAMATLMYKFLDNNVDNPAGEDEPMFYTQIIPNLVQDKLTLTVCSPCENKARIQLYDASGRLITNLYDGFVKMGTNTIGFLTYEYLLIKYLLCGD